MRLRGEGGRLVLVAPPRHITIGCRLVLRESDARIALLLLLLLLLDARRRLG